MRLRPRRLRRVILWLDTYEEPRGWQIQWMEDGEVVREVCGDVRGALSLVELLQRLDAIPRTVDPRALRFLDLAETITAPDATHRLKFTFPGWATPTNFMSYVDGYQQRLPLEPG